MSQQTTVQQPSQVLPTQGSLQLMPSSWIRDIRYNNMTYELEINMRGKWYGPWIIHPWKFHKFITGQAVPITTDTHRPARWGRGMGPSLGAAYWKYIKIGGTRANITRRFAEFKAKLSPVSRVSRKGKIGDRVLHKYQQLGVLP